MLENGYVKLPREIVGRSWFGDGTTLKVYVYLLCGAAFKDIEREGYTIRKGQYITSVNKLSETCRQSVRQTRTALTHLEKTKDIAIRTTSKFSIITVISMADDDDIDTLADILADKLGDKLNDNRSKSNKEEIKEKRIEEVKEGGTPARVEPVLFKNSLSSSSDPVGERETLVNEYGDPTVRLYESKFLAWVADKRPGIPMYPTIAKWLAQDIRSGQNVAHDTANGRKSRKGELTSLDFDEIERSLLAQYQRNTVQDNQNKPENPE